jgi:predicted PurR-regulated permease PerM
MTSIEQKKNIAKIVLVVSMMLLILLLFLQFYPGNSGTQTTIDSSPTDLKSAYDQIKKEYNDNIAKINTAQIKTNELNKSISELNSYSNKNIPKYAIGGGIGIIIGLWISTIILYIKVKKDLFKEG